MLNKSPRKPESLYHEVVLDDSERASQTKMIMRLFDLWQISPAQQAICLGLSPNTRTSISNYRTGKACLPLYRDTQDRIANLLAIHIALRKLFPENPKLVYGWINCRNRHFDNFTPLEVICRDNYRGIEKIKSYLQKALTV